MNFCYILFSVLVWVWLFPQFPLLYFCYFWLPEKRVANTSVNNLFMLLFAFIFLSFLLPLPDKQNKEMNRGRIENRQPYYKGYKWQPNKNNSNELPTQKGETRGALEFFKFFKRTLPI